LLTAQVSVALGGRLRWVVPDGIAASHFGREATDRPSSRLTAWLIVQVCQLTL